MRTIGYARVSTQDQKLLPQLSALKEAGCQWIFNEKISGYKAKRPEMEKMLKALEGGDVVVVTKLDRLGRSTRELLNLLEYFRNHNISFRSLGDPMWDTSTPQGRLLAVMLAAMAEFERSLIAERTTNGRKRAAAAGRRMGRKHKLTWYQRSEVTKRLNAGESATSIAKSFNVDPSTISRWNRTLVDSSATESAPPAHRPEIPTEIPTGAT